MAQVYTVTASTSVVLITSLQVPNTVVLLSSIQYPGHIVGIRDTTGSNQIVVNPVIVSTMEGLQFYDGTSSIVLNSPNGFLSVSSRDSSTWQLLNSIGFVKTLSNGFLEHLTSQTSYIQLTSTIQESVSSMIAGRITVTKTIEINGQTSIQGDITLGGSLDILSSARFYQDLYLSSGLRVGGNVSFPSSLAVLGALRIGSNLSTLETATIQENLTVSSNLNVLGALLPPYVSTQIFIASLLSTSGGLQLAGSLSTVSTYVEANATFLGDATFQNSTFVSGMTSVANSFFAESLRVGGNLRVDGAAAVHGAVTTGSFTTDSLSTLGSLRVSSCSASGDTVVQGETTVLFSSIVRALQVDGQGAISSLLLFSTLESIGDSSSYSSTFLTQSHLNIRGAFGIGQSISAPHASLSLSSGMSTFQDLRVGGNLVVNGLASFRDDSFVVGSFSTLSTLYIEGSVSTNQLDAKGQVFVDGNLFVSQLASASTLGAPISLSISTLTLSNTLVVSAVGTVPVLRMGSYPQKVLVGDAEAVGGYDVYVGGILQNRSTVLQSQSFDYTKLWSARDLYVSTFGGLSNLSSMVIGTTTFDYPFRSFDGLLVTGLRNDGLTSTNIVAASNQSTTFTAIPSGFGTQGNKIRYNGINQWVAAGEGVTIPPAFPTVRKAQSLKASPNGYTWVNAVTGGFTVGALDVAYGDGKWVAVGSNNPMAPPEASIQYSTDGLTWSNAIGQVFPSNGFGQAIAYNGSNLWVAAGTDPTAFGLRWSSNGTTWFTGTSLFGPLPPLAFYSVGFGGGKWFATITSGIKVFESTNGSNWIESPSTNIGRRVYKYITLGTQSYWIGGGDTIPSPGGDPTTTIQISPTAGCNWIPIASGGFKNSCYDILDIPQLSTVVAVGSDGVPVENILQYSIDLRDWIGVPVFLGEGFGVGYGPTIGPDTQPYFTGNLTNIFRSTLSSTYIKASTVTASSFTGVYSADGSLLTAVGSYTSSILVSSLKAQTIRTYDISAERFTNLSTTVQDSITVNRKTFLSAANIFLAAGNDSQPNGNIQTSATGSAWERALDANFEFYGNDIAGTSNSVNPLYVAAGADSRTLYTLLHSINGRVWNPAATGGFSYATSIGLKEAKSVVYSATLSKWVALGVDTGGTDTIQYSADGINWLSATGGFSDYGTKVKAANGTYVAIGNGGARFSLDGINWFLSAPQVVFTAIGYGTILVYGVVWLAVSETFSTSYFSQNNGITWTPLTPVASVPINDIHYANGVWIAVGGNQIRRSTDGINWSDVTTTFGTDVTFKSIAYNSDSATWVAGAESLTAANTIFRSSDTFTWTGATLGGFSTSVDSYGFGIGLTTLGFATFAVGKSAVDINVEVKPRIFSVSTLGGSPSTTITNFSLTNSNASNVFSSIVRGIAAAPDEFYKYVAVGDGATPQKTIARSVDGTAGSWIPAVTGGFTPSGYGVTYSQGSWWATGDATTTLNTIQYSPDGGNWFGTNTAEGIRFGGRGIVAGVSSLTGTFVAVGKDTTTSTIVRSQDGYTWVPASNGYFDVQGNGVAAGLRTPALPFPGAPYKPCFVAVGQDTRGTNSTIMSSEDGHTWIASQTGSGFSIAGYGATYSFDKFLWVAVGEDANPDNTIQVNYTGAVAGWVGIGSNGFTKAGYAVAYNSSLSTFFAVGEDLGGNSELTIKTSPNGTEWFNISSPSGFISQKNLGAANSLFTQGILTQESIPYIDFANLVLYERTTPLLYTRPTIRLQSSFVAFNESLFVNTSSQMVIGSQTPIGLNALTVYGDVFTPSLTLPPLTSLPMMVTISTLTISTLSTVSSLFTELFTTPFLGITSSNAVASLHTANEIVVTTTGGGGGWTGDNGTTGFLGNLLLNNTLYAYTIPQSIQYPQPIGIGTANSPGSSVVSQPNRKECVVDGSLGASTLSTFYLLTSSTYISASNVFFEDQYLSMVDSTDDSYLTTGNRIQFNASSMTLNSIVTLQTSTQRLGIHTRNPHFDLDVQCAAVLSNVYASTLNAPLLFLTLQSI